MMEIDAGAIIKDNGKYLVICTVGEIWGFPKGHAEPGESLQETAKREVKEEVGIDIRLTDITEEIIYTMSKGIEKKITFFFAEPVTRDIRLQEEEIKDYAWLTAEGVLEKLSFDDLKELFRRMLKRIQD